MPAARASWRVVVCWIERAGAAAPWRAVSEKTALTDVQDRSVFSSVAFSRLSTVRRYFSLTLMMESAKSLPLFRWQGFGLLEHWPRLQYWYARDAETVYP